MKQERRKPRRKRMLYTFSLSPDVVREFRKVCDEDLGLPSSRVVEILMRAVVEGKSHSMFDFGEILEKIAMDVLEIKIGHDRQ